MVEKNIVHNKLEPCVLSKELINTGEEKYAIIIQCDKDEILSTKFYKLNMLKDLFEGKMKLVEQSMMNEVRKMASKIPMLGGSY